MDEQPKTLSQRQKLLSELRRLNFKSYTDEKLSYTYPLLPLIRLYPLWKTLILIIDIYFINECYLWLPFPNYYYYSLTTLLPLGLVFLMLLFFNLVFRVCMTPKLPQIVVRGLDQRGTLLLTVQHYLRYKDNVWYLAVDVAFAISYMVPYPAAKYLHLVYAFKVVTMRQLSADLYSEIHTVKFLRIGYHLLALFLVIFYLSHFLGCIFYVMDQQLINGQYFGDPVTNPNLYYQFSSQTFTPIEMLSQFQRYIMAFYFANGLVTTIAYGDIVGKNYIEDAYVGVLMVVSTIGVAFLLEEFMIMLRDNSFEVFEIIKKFRHLRLAMNFKQVSEDLQLRIRNYIFYREYYDKFNKLSTKMQLDLCQEGFAEFLRPVMRPLRVDNIRLVCSFLKEVTYQPEIEIFPPQPKEKGKKLDNQHYLDRSVARPNYTYLLSGKALQYLRWNSKSKEFKINQGIKSLNLFEFLTETRVRCGLRSKTVLKGVTLARQDFSIVLKEDQQLQKRFKQEKEQVLSCCISRTRFQDSCYFCGESDHSIFSCPEVFFVVDEQVHSAQKMEEILRKGKPRKSKSRKAIKSKKQRNTLHYSVMLQQLDFFALIEGVERPRDEPELEDLGASMIQKMLKSICEKTLAVDLQEEVLSADAAYDQNGVDAQWSLQFLS